jgi:hypothetical protein
VIMTYRPYERTCAVVFCAVNHNRHLRPRMLVPRST